MTRPDHSINGELFPLRVSNAEFSCRYLAFEEPALVHQTFATIKALAPPRMAGMCKALPFRHVALGFSDYFEHNFVGVVGHRASFPIDNWNVRDRVMQDLPRTTSAHEAFHRHLKVR